MNRNDLHQLIDGLPEHALWPARRFLEFLAQDDPLGRALDEAPWDDEPLTEAEKAAIQQGLAELEAGQGVSHAEALRLLELSP